MKIEWCLEKEGLQRIMPNETLAKSYMDRAKKDYDILKFQDSY